MKEESKIMDFKTLQKKVKAIEREENAFMSKCFRKEQTLKLRYIKEHAPMELRENQHIIVKLRGKRIYSVDAIFLNWWISPTGEVRPNLYAKDYRTEDEIISIELHEHQPEGDCKKCMKQKDGLCYKAGGKSISKKCATGKVKDIVCPKYEEVVENGLWGKKTIYPCGHVPNVTFTQDAMGKRTYRLYSLNWHCFTEHSENFINQHYSFEPIDYNDNTTT